MRVLIVAEDPERRASLSRDLERAGHQVAGGSDAVLVAAKVRETGPEALLVVAPDSTNALRLLLTRARGAAERPLPVVLLLSEASIWLRAPLPADLSPAVQLASTDSSPARLTSAFASFVGGARGAGAARFGTLDFDYAARVLRCRTSDGDPVSLTPSEVAVLSSLLAAPGAFVSSLDLSRALWGEALTDTHARGAIRSHVHTLRGKLVAAGFDGSLESRTGFGYRLMEA